MKSEAVPPITIVLRANELEQTPLQQRSLPTPRAQDRSSASQGESALRLPRSPAFDNLLQSHGELVLAPCKKGNYDNYKEVQFLTKKGDRASNLTIDASPHSKNLFGQTIGKHMRERRSERMITTVADYIREERTMIKSTTGALMNTMRTVTAMMIGEESENQQLRQKFLDTQEARSALYPAGYLALPEGPDKEELKEQILTDMERYFNTKPDAHIPAWQAQMGLNAGMLGSMMTGQNAIPLQFFSTSTTLISTTINSIIHTPIKEVAEKIVSEEISRYHQKKQAESRTGSQHDNIVRRAQTPAPGRRRHVAR